VVNANLESAELSVADVMRTDVHTLGPETSVEAAHRIVSDQGIDCLLVLEDGTLTGIVCRDDLRGAELDTHVAECMSSPVLCVGSDTSPEDAVAIMLEERISCLPVVKGTHVVGIITRAALSRMGFGSEWRNFPSDDAGACVSCGGAESVGPHPRLCGLGICVECAGRVSQSASGADPSG